MARRVKEIDWVDIRVKYELGYAIRAIAREYDIHHGTIQHRIKKEGWEQSLAVQVSEIKGKISEISQVANPAQMVAIEKELTDAMQIAKSITDLQCKALQLHNVVLNKAITQTSSGEMSVKEASQILAATGLKVDQIHKMNNPTSELELNNNTTQEIKIKLV